MGFFSWAFLVFRMKESKERRQKQPGKVSFPAGQFSWCPAVNEPPSGGPKSLRIVAVIRAVNLNFTHHSGGRKCEQIGQTYLPASWEKIKKLVNVHDQTNSRIITGLLNEANTLKHQEMPYYTHFQCYMHR